MDIASAGQYLSFNLAGAAYAVPIGMVREINRVLQITPMPETPEYVCGVMNLRGNMIPIIDLKLRFGMARGPITKQSCIIVAETPAGLCGMLVDSILGVVTLTTDNIEPRPSLGRNDKSTCVNGMGRAGETIFILIDIPRVVSSTLTFNLQGAA
jgi:purine-binding chemotaxis protein CheW